MGEIFVAYDNNTSSLHEMNEVAYRILEAIEKGQDKEKILNGLAKRFQVDRKRAEKDYKEFVKLLEKKDLIEL